MLRDRREERAALDDLLRAVRSGASRALLIRGEAGIGKTALLDYLASEATGCRVLRISGSEPEMDIAFAALHQLSAPLLDRLGRLPGPQQETLRTVFGLAAGPPPDELLIGLSLLSLLAEAATDRPLICLVDDAQWLDTATLRALTFAARRVQAESVGLALAVREPYEGTDFGRLPEVTLGGLPEQDARILLASTFSGPADDRIIERILVESQGNPLALLELPRDLISPAAGGFALPTATAVPRQLDREYQRRLAQLPPRTRLLLLVAAADPMGDPALVWRAAGRLGIGPDAASPATDRGLLRIDSRVRFRHPLVRSVVYRTADPADRRLAHRALADATADSDPECRYWHAAQGAPGPDEAIAAGLEHSAALARARGGIAALVAFLEKATSLTLDPARRAARALAAAEAKYDAGAYNAALGLLGIAEAGPLEPAQRARADIARARAVWAQGRGADTPALLVRAADQLAAFDVWRSRDTYLEALATAMLAGVLASGDSARELAEAARRARPTPSPPRPADHLLNGLAVRFVDGYAAGVPALERALSAFRVAQLADDDIRWLPLACAAAAHLWDVDTWAVLAARKVTLTRAAGALSTLPLALDSSASCHVISGELAAAESLLDELQAVGEVTGTSAVPMSALLRAAWQGDDTALAGLAERAAEEVKARGASLAFSITSWSQAVLANSTGRYTAALTAANEASQEYLATNMSPGGALAELIEAASRTGHGEQAAAGVERLGGITKAAGTAWAAGIEARCQALIADGQAAEERYRAAIDTLATTRVRGELARAHLLYGEWLRRAGRPADAREQLRTAHLMFTDMGMMAFAERTAAELRAAGGSVGSRNGDGADHLTAQKAQIARLVRDGLSNVEIAARMFISPRTVEWHLSNVFAKLQITSRRQLRG
jgi:DNA-binding CsgD family transcriptional regulator